MTLYSGDTTFQFYITVCSEVKFHITVWLERRTILHIFAFQAFWQ
jgi:hypothetical protein